MKNFKIASDFNTAVEMASEILGYGMFECYENVQAENAKRHEKYGTEKFYVTESGKILWVFHYEGQRIMNIITGPSGSCISAGRIGLVKMSGDEITVVENVTVEKSNHIRRRLMMKDLGADYAFADTDVLNEVAA